MPPDDIDLFCARLGLDDATSAALRALLETRGPAGAAPADPYGAPGLTMHPDMLQSPAVDSQDEGMDSGNTVLPQHGGSEASPAATLAGSGPAPRRSLVARPRRRRRIRGEDPPDHPRYESLGRLGRGASSVVFEVLDRQLHHRLAMKVMAQDPAEHPTAAARFAAEARVMARLQHPGLVPVHELGRLSDGRLYYTMAKVQGRTLSEAIHAVHPRRDRHVDQGLEDWNLRRLVEAFRRVCQAVAPAHAAGVIHRDLKPDNIMLGPFGQVLVMDWGLVKQLSDGDADLDTEEVERSRLEEPDASTTMRADPVITRPGVIAGTPAYMSPEQARGEVASLGQASDIYSLGRVLEQILVGRLSILRGEGARELVRYIASGPNPMLPTHDREGRPIPEALREIAMRCLQPSRGARFPDAAALAGAVSDWLDGVRAREEALARVAQARELRPRIAMLRERADTLYREAEERLETLAPYEPEERKAPAWRLQDEAAELERQAAVESVRFTRVLQSALEQVPDLPEANALLADHYQTLHQAAEEDRREDDAARFEALLEAHDTGRHAAWLRGEGAVTLVTEPAGARVRLFRFVQHNRRLRPELVEELGRTPIVERRLDKGSYLLEVDAPGRATMRYPVHIGRGEHWSSVPPGGDRPAPVPLLLAEDLGPDDCYVPPGWFTMGGDPQGEGGGPARRVWLDGFVMRRYHVTNADYIRFLDALVAEGSEELALRYAPRERTGKDHSGGQVVYNRTPSGGFTVGADADGDVWLPDAPVILVDFEGASAYAAWEGSRTGQPWRLPWEAEFEKAARGVDGRFFPWGDFFDASWCMTRQSVEGDLLPKPVTTFPVDESPYGLRGMAGHAMIWCLDQPHPSGPVMDGARIQRAFHPEGTADLRGIRGGSWNSHPTHSRAARRDATGPVVRGYYLSLRLTRSVGGEGGDDGGG